MVQKHTKVVLTGTGPDELFAGYTRYLVAHLEGCLKKAIYGKAEMVPEISIETILPGLSHLRDHESMLQHFLSGGILGDPADRYFRLMQRMDDIEHLICPDLLASGGYTTRDAFRREFYRTESGSLIDHMMGYDVRNQLPALLHLEDRASMAASVESRVPFLDHRLVEFATSIPARLRVGDGSPKHLFRKAVSHVVPGAVLSRTDKMGFPVPLFQWFTGPLRSYVEDMLLGETARSRGLLRPGAAEQCLRSERPFGRTIWGLLCLELWYRAYID